MWKSSIWLIKKELKFHSGAFLLTMLAAAFIGLITIPLFDLFARQMYGGEDIFYSKFVHDLIFLGILPSFSALFMSGPYLTFRTIKEDPFGKRIGFYRALPIPISVIALSRIVFMLLTLLTMSIVFYTVLTIGIAEPFFQYVSVENWMIFIIAWFGYTLLFGSFNTFVEFGTNGKMLYLFSFVFLLIYIVLTLLFQHVYNVGIVESSFRLIEDYGWFAASISVLVGGSTCVIFYHILKKRLLTRDYV
ncbi:hypothetical protein ACERJO_00940 [Halalkalibacter sp. AB-rgal2]|uniref:hypothetical protein n=1 Tax=Halalkalibacter sp. AB-rgal2 TaxID=3242695 RepID=UPI00359DDBBA